MAYVDGNLLSGERVLYRAYIHWFIFVPGALLFAVGIIIVPMDTEGGTGPVFGLMAILLSIFLLVKALVEKLTTELAVTSKRVIAKVGFIRRNTAELNHSKVESFNVDQSVLARIFGFGTVTINGTGGGRTRIPNISAPLKFRKEAIQIIDSSQSAAPQQSAAVDVG